MDSVLDTAEAVGCPIRKSSDQGLLAAPRSLSQRATSFIASQCQGIHQMPFLRLILEAYSAARRNKPARDLSRHKMLHNTSPFQDRTSCVLGHSLIALHIVQDPNAPKRVEPSRKHPFPRRKSVSVRRDAPAAGVMGGESGSRWDRLSLERR